MGLSNRGIRLLLVILMFIPLVSIFAAIAYLFMVLIPSNVPNKGLRLIFFILVFIPFLNIIGAIGLLLMELGIIKSN